MCDTPQKSNIATGLSKLMVGRGSFPLKWSLFRGRLNFFWRVLIFPVVSIIDETILYLDWKSPVPSR